MADEASRPASKILRIFHVILPCWRENLAANCWRSRDMMRIRSGRLMSITEPRGGRAGLDGLARVLAQRRRARYPRPWPAARSPHRAPSRPPVATPPPGIPTPLRPSFNKNRHPSPSLRPHTQPPPPTEEAITLGKQLASAAARGSRDLTVPSGRSSASVASRCATREMTPALRPAPAPAPGRGTQHARAAQQHRPRAGSRRAWRERTAISAGWAASGVARGAGRRGSRSKRHASRPT